MTQRRVLVVEDDPAIRRGLIDALTFEGYLPVEAATAEAGLAIAASLPCDLALLDVILPGKDGLELMRQLRLRQPDLPIILVTARGAETDRVGGLRRGADDYVVKPFSVKELLARVASVLRRSPSHPGEQERVRLPGVTVDLARSELEFEDGDVVALSEREAQLLRYLSARAGSVVSREELLQRVWGLDPAGLETRTIDMHVARLREKLRDDPNQPRILKTVRGKGYVCQPCDSES